MIRRLAPAIAATLLAACALATNARYASASELCPDEQSTRQVPSNLQLCAELESVVRQPHSLPLDKYEAKLSAFLGAFCHRRLEGGWKMDKTVRDTGPFTATLADGKWSGTYSGTHAPVLVWYSPDMIAWLRVNRPQDSNKAPTHPPPVPDGAMMVKEMYSPPPASNCRVPDLLRLMPVEQGAAVMVRDSLGSFDGWFWGWFGWSRSQPDWPAQPGNLSPAMGFGRYCTNCHASAKDNSTFASLDNIKDEPGTFLAFLSQDFYRAHSDQIETQFSQILQHQRRFMEARRERATTLAARPTNSSDIMSALRLPEIIAPSGQIPARLLMPSQTYDSVWVAANGPTASDTFITSDQCVGCHSAGGTGLQFEMTRPAGGAKMFNLSPYGSWRTTPMGLAGRDPVFFSQLASEMQSFHKEISPKVQDSCLGCHGIMGQRQFLLDRTAVGGTCPDFLRQTVNAIPYPDGNNETALARYGALARDGVSCAACHHMVLRDAETVKYRDEAQNRCVVQRQDFLNPDTTHFARILTGSFLLGSPKALYGPFASPKPKPMQRALGITPEHNTDITSAEACGTCHTVRLPVMVGTQTLNHVHEQTTYSEWAFSDYRTGLTPDGPLPLGPGPRAESCQGCHMPSKNLAGGPFLSKVASIQEHSNFPQVANGLPAEDLDLPLRKGFAQHVLVGLNVFLIEMAAQFPEVLGIRSEDPMMGDRQIAPITFTRDAMRDQAAHASAEIQISSMQASGGMLSTTVTVTNKAGHKLPSGVGFRRMFIDFRVLDSAGRVLWESGRTDKAGIITDQVGEPVAGELWWNVNCSTRVNPLMRIHQPHYQTITRQDQAQIYQELVAAPTVAGAAQCGHEVAPLGELTTSFLSICSPVKDNRILPHGFLPRDARIRISRALGAGSDMADDTAPVAVGDDPDYRSGGSDSLIYQVVLSDLRAAADSVEATLYYQAIPPYFLQDRFCTASGDDMQRLAYLVRQLDLTGSSAADWKLQMVSTGRVPVTR